MQKNTLTSGDKNALDAHATVCEITRGLTSMFQAEKVVLFGSVGRGDFNRWSDIDLAVWGIPPCLFYKAVAFASSVSKNWKIDLVDANDCSEGLLQNILREGIIMDNRKMVLVARILAELKELSILVKRVETGWQRAKDNQDDYYLDGVALNLHGFYSGLERIFVKIASSIDENVPSGLTWHQELLNQMNTDIPGIRPAVISSSSKESLKEYCGFRHIVRNLYSYQLKPEKLAPLVTNLSIVMSNIEKDMAHFVEKLEKSDS